MSSVFRPQPPRDSPDADFRVGDYVDTDAHPPESAVDSDQMIWAGRRKAQPLNALLPVTLLWLRSLPTKRRPNALASDYPRLANLIAASWDNPSECSAFLCSLLHDKRGGRRGFPDQILQDILNLRIRYSGLHPGLDWPDYRWTYSHRPDSEQTE